MLSLFGLCSNDRSCLLLLLWLLLPYGLLCHYYRLLLFNFRCGFWNFRLFCSRCQRLWLGLSDWNFYRQFSGLKCDNWLHLSSLGRLLLRLRSINCFNLRFWADQRQRYRLLLIKRCLDWLLCRIKSLFFTDFSLSLSVLNSHGCTILRFASWFYLFLPSVSLFRLLW